MSFKDTHITPFIGVDETVDTILFFTDNTNEPRRINIRRCIEDDEALSGNALSYIGEDLEDFITACPKAPIKPISFKFSLIFDLGSTESKFAETDGIIFAYQNVYEDGWLSPLSPFSKVAYPPRLKTLGVDAGSTLIEKECVLSIPSQSQEIKEVRILFKEGDFGYWKIVDVINAKEDVEQTSFEYIGDDDLIGKYTFDNNRVYPLLPLDESVKYYDALPRKAKAQAVSGGRLMYGNYVEGFNPIKTKSSGQVEYIPRPTDLTSIRLGIEPTIFENEDTDGYTGADKGTAAGFIIDVEGLPDVIPAGAYEFQLSFRTKNNLHLYNTDVNGFRGSRNITNDGVTDFSAELSPITAETDLDLYLPSGSETSATPLFTNNTGVASITWKTGAQNPWSTYIGTAPSSPLILNVDEISFSLKLSFSSDITKNILLQAITATLTGPSNNSMLSSIMSGLGVEILDLPYFEWMSNGGFVVDSKPYGAVIEKNIDLNLQSGGVFSQESSFAELVCAVKKDSEECAGFFILNKAKVRIGFEVDASSSSGFKKGFRLKVIGVDAEDVMTCLPVPAMGRGSKGSYFLSATADENTTAYGPEDEYADTTETPFLLEPSKTYTRWPWIRSDLRGGLANGDWNGSQTPYRIGEWHVFSKADLSGVDSGVENTYKAKINNIQGTNFTVNPDLGLNYDDTLRTWVTNLNHLLKVTAPGSTGYSYRWDGYVDSFTWNAIGLDPSSNSEFDGNGNAMPKQMFSVVDGEAGPGGRMSSEHPYSDTSIGADGTTESLTVSSIVSGDISATESSPASGGNWIFDTGFLNASGVVPAHNRKGSVWSTTLIGIVDNLPFLTANKIYKGVSEEENIGSVDPIKRDSFNSSPMEAANISSTVSTGNDEISSFKTRATHDFGIVYYDSRGRSGAVNKLDSVYVPGYSSEERGNHPKGATNIRMNLQFIPPSWAHRYKIYYSNRNEAKRFIQYSAGGAFVEKGDVPKKDKIYVSLNYLQGYSESYAGSYGARSQDTDEPKLYRYSAGDKLRVISYYDDDDARKWANDEAVFDVLDTKYLSNDLESHPLFFASDSDPYERLVRNGEFVVLRDNSDASGFTALDIDENQDKWKNRCVFEIISPQLEIDDKVQGYFETDQGGEIKSNYDGTKYHEFSYHIMTEGDVFFRAVPTNMRDWDPVTATFKDIFVVNDENENVSSSNFKNYYLETQGVTDLHKTNSKGYGRPNFIEPNQRDARLKASVKFSQITEPDTFKIKYTSFPVTKENSFHLPEKHKELNYLVGFDESITAIQENKVSYIPVDRALTATVSGDESLNISQKVLNTAKFESSSNGCSNAESVVEAEGAVYFVDKRNRAVIKLGSKGAVNISNVGMEEYFKRHITNLLKSSEKEDYSDIRIVGGFDPAENEFIVSFISPSDINSVSLTGEAHPQRIELISDYANDEFSSNEDTPINTIAWDHLSEVWKTRYSFNSTNYARVNNKLISFKPGQNGELVWLHGANEKRNFFHGHQYQSAIKVVSNFGKSLGASETKAFRSISFEGNSKWPSIIKTQKDKARVAKFEEREGEFYANLPKSESVSSSSNIKAIGIVKSIELFQDPNSSSAIEAIITFKSPVGRYPINLGDHVDCFLSEATEDSNVIETGLRPVEIIGDYSIRYILGFMDGLAAEIPDVWDTNEDGQIADEEYLDLSAGDLSPEIIAAFEGKTMIHKSNSAIFGDTLRDKFATITAINASDEPVELFAINVKATDSKLSNGL